MHRTLIFVALCAVKAASSVLEIRAIDPFHPDLPPDVPPAFPPDDIPHVVPPVVGHPPHLIPGGDGQGAQDPEFPSGPEGLEFFPADTPNDCLKEECEEVSEEAPDLMKKLTKLTNLLPSSSSTSSTASPTITPVVTAAPIPYYNIATAAKLDQSQLAIFNADEQAMYFRDPLCFFANIEHKYAGTTTASAVPAASAAVHRRAQSSIAPNLVPQLQSQVFGSDLPEQILSIYSPVSNGSNLRVTTRTTMCSGLDGAEPFTMPYAIKVESATPTPASSGSAPEVSSGAAQLKMPQGVVLLGAATFSWLVTAA